MRVVLAFAIVSFLYVGSARARELKILNLNMWAVELQLPEFIVKSPSVELDARMRRLPAEIAKLAPDIVVFEEIWSDARAEKVKDMLRAIGFAYSARGSAAHGWLLGGGNGLLIVSKLKLDPGVRAMAFDETTRWDESKWICRKGVLKTRVEVEPNAWVDLYATHLGAAGLVFKNKRAVEFLPEQIAAQTQQVRELMAFVRQTQTSPDLILAADLNSHPFVFQNGKYSQTKHTDVYRLLTCADGAPSGACLDLRDSAAGAAYFTYDTLRNHYAHNADFSNEPEGRIDYLFSQGDDLKIDKTTLVLTQNPISDHYGIVGTFEYGAPLRLPTSAR
jgi:hypothetical protein